MSIDYVESVKYLKAAADQCDEMGELNYGICLFEGHGVRRDQAKAFEFFERSTNQGNVTAEVNVGFCYHEGLGVKRDYLKSAEYFRRSVAQGNVVGEFNYSLSLYRGDGIEIDFVYASEYLMLSADKGFAPAQRAYGNLILVCSDIDTVLAACYFGRAAESNECLARQWDTFQRIDRPVTMIRLSERKSVGSIDAAPSRTLDIRLIKRKAGLIPPRPIFRELDVNVDLFWEVKLLGSGVFGVVKLMENFCGEIL
jgi:TPR repeat protein